MNVSGIPSIVAQIGVGLGGGVKVLALTQGQAGRQAGRLTNHTISVAIRVQR
jgi:hypothetical protein